MLKFMVQFIADRILRKCVFESNNDFLEEPANFDCDWKPPFFKIVNWEINDDKLCVKTCPLSFEEKFNDETDRNHKFR